MATEEAKQGALGAEQGKLRERQQQLHREAQVVLRSMMDQALSNGIARRAAHRG